MLPTISLCARVGGDLLDERARPERIDIISDTTLRRFHDRFRVTQNRQSGIVNDPNAWFADPHDLIAAIRRIVYLSMETARIVGNLPDPFADTRNDPAGPIR